MKKKALMILSLLVLFLFSNIARAQEFATTTNALNLEISQANQYLMIFMGLFIGFLWVWWLKIKGPR